MKKILLLFIISSFLISQSLTKGWYNDSFEIPDSLWVDGIQITGGTPGVGKALISDAGGVGTWQTLAAGHAAVTLNANATAAGLSLVAQEINYRASTNAQSGYATAAQITAQEANTAHKSSNGTDHSLLGATPGTATASIALIVDANKDVTLDGGDFTAVLGTFTGNLKSNSNNVFEGDNSGRLVLRKSALLITPGATPNTNINIDVNQATRDWNQPTITDATNLAASGTSGSFSLSATPNTITVDISEVVKAVFTIDYGRQDLNSSGSAVYWIDTQIVAGNILLSIRITGSTVASNWTDILDAGDSVNVIILYITST